MRIHASYLNNEKNWHLFESINNRKVWYYISHQKSSFEFIKHFKNKINFHCIEMCGILDFHQIHDILNNI
jgi:hypothetical protein